MPQRHELFTVTVPANTPIAAPIEVATAFDPGRVRKITLKIPSGHASLTGIAFAVAHQQMIPRTVGQWIRGDSDKHEWEVENYPESGAWSVFVWNVDNRAHYWQVQYAVDDKVTRGHRRVVPVEPIPVDRIYRADGR